MSINTPSVTNFTAGEMSPRLQGRTDLSKYFNGCRVLENFHIHPHGGATRRSGFRFVAEALTNDKPELLIPFEYNGELTYVLELAEDETGQGKLRVFPGNATGKSAGGEYTRDIPYVSSEFDSLRYAQSAEKLILVHPDHPVRILSRENDTNWSLEEMTFLGKPEDWTDNNHPSAVGFYEQRLVLSGTRSKPGTIWFSRTGEMTDFRLKTREVPLSGWADRTITDANNDERKSGQEDDTIVLLDGDGFEKTDGIKGQHTDGTTRYYRYKGDRIFTTDGADRTITFKMVPGHDDIEAIWSAEGELQSQYWECFTVGDRVQADAGDTPLADDAIEATLSGYQANTIEFVVPRSRLWIGTAGGEWTISSATNEPLSPDTIKATHEGTCGASRCRPESVGFATLFIQRAGRKVREMAYRFESDAYVSRDLTVMSEHITDPGLKEMTYAQEPDSVVYCVRKDGALATMTYDPVQEVVGWGRIHTDGFVENVTSVFSSTAEIDRVWVVVRRTINGEERRMIEFLEGPFNGTIGDGFFVDSGVSHDGVPITKLTGMGHLSGRTVHILADGAVHPPQRVSSSGTITLDRPASKIHAGLPYTSTLQPMRMEGGSHRGTAQTKKKRITKVSVRFHETLGGKIGPAPDKLESIHFRSPSTPMGQGPGAFSGDKTVVFPKGWDRDGYVTVVQDQPLPMTLLLIVPTALINE